MLAVVATAATDAGAAQNLAGGILLGLSAGLGSSFLRRTHNETASGP